MFGIFCVSQHNLQITKNKKHSTHEKKTKIG